MCLLRFGSAIIWVGSTKTRSNKTSLKRKLETRFRLLQNCGTSLKTKSIRTVCKKSGFSVHPRKREEQLLYTEEFLVAYPIPSIHQYFIECDLCENQVAVYNNKNMCKVGLKKVSGLEMFPAYEGRFPYKPNKFSG